MESFEMKITSLLRIVAISSALMATAGCTHGTQRLPSSSEPHESSSLGNSVSAEDDDVQETIRTAPITSASPGLYNNETGTPVFALVDSAKRSLDVEIYEMSDLDFRAAIRRALQRKVTVRIIKEPAPIGEKCKMMAPVTARDSDDCQDQKQLVAEILAHGGKVVPFNKAELCGEKGKTCFEHGKMVIADQKYVMLSTGNFNASNLCNHGKKAGVCNRDFSYISHRPFIVEGLSVIFEKDLNGQSYDLPAAVSARFKRKITVSPFSSAPLVEFIGSAKHSIEIENQYLKDPVLNQALIAASNRGVAVSVTLSSLCSFGQPKDGLKREAERIFGAFDAAHIKTQMFTSQMKVGGRSGYLHAKVIVVDGWKAWMGSVNGSTMSTSRNREYGIFFWNPFSVDHLKKIIRADQSDPRGETWQESLQCLRDHKTEDDSGDGPRSGEE